MRKKAMSVQSAASVQFTAPDGNEYRYERGIICERDDSAVKRGPGPFLLLCRYDVQKYGQPTDQNLWRCISDVYETGNTCLYFW
ncbi:hypothetical protein [Pectobacterium carotovorum]|uniref:hypothetical protein n=1 Tax=Pectobacterium carotovorum TaxID=554 RepID=UPI0005041B0E|nr:hypothetical protein [Pectobacterium carotovorum]KFW97588.1 hypothetical protein JV33_21535 [Pectobacterium carotovorum subsp. carotovorum]KML64942.1 hypothetical protein G032_20985 [Pectobacterium carotovorum subsp. carotovorum ICMP 5702]SHH68153.1 hypothetical protein SAMN05444147_11610 [Pectobacterium carotovorum]